MARRIESFFVNGPAGRLEALLEAPDEAAPVEAALVCHPHPRYGGTMHNKVVYRLARGLRKTGCAVLRFNYRGVNLSQGEYGHGFGETDDARAALAELRRRYPDFPLLTAGFSFGSRIALRLAVEEPGVQRTIAVGFPTKYPNREFIYDVRVPKYFVQSTHDEHGPRPELTEFYDSLPQPKQLDWVESIDHFFKDNLQGFEDVVEAIGNRRTTSGASDGSQFVLPAGR
ncbi:MAG: alpha/beta hydrolase [Acidobacteriota bacterium]|nr:alpha/beta hydrolase [Acidobacteriota bacterium]